MPTPRARYMTILLVAVFGFVIVGAPVLAAPKKFIFGFLPILSPERLANRFEPLADYVALKMGVAVRLETAPDFEEFMRRTLRERRYDLLFTAPHFYYTASRRAGYRVVARVSGRRLRAVIVAPTRSGIRTLKDLRGKSLSTPSAQALATLLIRARLIVAGINPDADVTLVETPTHNASLMSAHKAFTDAAGLIEPPFSRADPSIKSEMGMLAETESTPHMPFSVAPWLPRSLADSFGEALVGLSSTEEGRSILAHLHWPGFVRATSEEYDALRRFVRP